jgi:hypothetical protein
VCESTFDRLTAGQFPVDCENEWLAKDGGRRTIQWSNSALLDGAGAARYVIGTGIDVTAREHAETGPRTAERELAETNVDLEQRDLERTLELEAANDELEAFSYSVSSPTSCATTARASIRPMSTSCSRRSGGFTPPESSPVPESAWPP